MSNTTCISTDPDKVLTDEQRMKFLTLGDKYDDVFASDISGYNGAVGDFKAVINMGPVQPP